VSTSAEPTPPAIHYGEDICALCGMIVSEESYAAAYVTHDGHAHTFDDIGDMVQSYLKQEEPERISALFVHDYESRGWIRAETSLYVLSPELHTPMLSGLIALASSEKAQALANELPGQMLTFDELLTRYHEMASTAMEGAEDHTPHHK
jgi:nitrous oxide reductase accessory protein NosL